MSKVMDGIERKKCEMVDPHNIFSINHRLSLQSSKENLKQEEEVVT